jgi:hypothetical protein
VRRADIYASAFLLVAGLLVLFVVIPAEAEGDTWSGVSPLFFPTIVAAGFTICCAAMLFQAIFRPGGYEGQELALKRGNFGFFMVACAIILATVLLIHYLGFLWGGPLLVAALMLFMGERNWLRIIPMSVVPVVVIYFFITRVLTAPLPGV